MTNPHKQFLLELADLMDKYKVDNIDVWHNSHHDENTINVNFKGKIKSIEINEDIMDSDFKPSTIRKTANEL